MNITRRDILAGSAALPFSPRSFAQQATGPKPRFGINLSGPPADWNTEQAFVNVFRLSRPWISQREGAPWGEGPPLELDEYGWVKSLRRGCAAETLICSVSDGHYPSGQYTVLFDGAGELYLRGATRIVSRDSGRIVVDVDSSSGGFGLRIEATDPNNYVRNLRVMMPGFETRTDAEPFRPDFLQRWHGVSCLRFMDWMHTNDSEIVSWSERPTPRHATYTKLGVDVESMIELAHELKADPWFCMPHLADDDYVRNFALAVAERLSSNLRVWVEYSNEVWNSSFRQRRDAEIRGKQLGFTGEPWETAWRYTAYRSKQIFDIWESEFGRDGRLVRVLPSQAASTRASKEVLEFHNAYESGDVLAIAPYIPCIVQRAGAEGLTASIVENWSVDQALDYMDETALPLAVESIAKQKVVADRYGLKLVAYEAGQHMVGVNGAENSEKVTSLFQAANAHPRMGDIYRRYYQAWTELGGDLLCAYSSVDGWSKWGSWGLMRYTDEEPLLSPKYLASVEWARQCGQPMGVG